MALEFCAAATDEKEQRWNMESFHLNYFNMTLQCVRVRRGKRCWQERNENEAAPERGCSWRVWIRVIRQPQRALTDHAEKEDGAKEEDEEEEQGAERNAAR